MEGGDSEVWETGGTGMPRVRKMQHTNLINKLEDFPFARES